MITMAEANIGIGTREIIAEVARSHGYEHLKEEQLLAIDEFVSGNDVFVSLPTGFGKSLIYGLIPPVIDRLRGHTRTTLVALIVSPLASLMIDQKFRSRRKRSGVCGVTDSRTRLYVTE